MCNGEEGRFDVVYGERDRWGRTGHFAFVDTVSVEYNSGWPSGVLEIHPAAHSAAQSGGYWRVSRSKDDK